MKKIFIIVAEQSGDLLGSKLIRELNSKLAKQDESAKFIGIGGELMKKEGFESIFPMEELCVMGFLEVVPHIPQLLKRINQTVEAIRVEKPDFIITIDAPDFSFRVIKKINDLCLRLGRSNIAPGKRIHLIAPSVWAYREGRAKKISKIYDLLLAILPFEPAYFERYGLKTVFIGHPLIDNSIDISQKESLNREFRQKYQIGDDDIVICLTPGSRTSEVKKIFPEFIKTVNLLQEKYQNIKVVIPLVNKTRKIVEKKAEKIQAPYFLIENDDKEAALHASNFALAKSGTNAVEMTLHQIPTIVAYKTSAITYAIIKMVAKVKFANLINLVANKEIIPEMLQDKCRGDLLAEKLEGFIRDKNLAEKQITESQKVLQKLGLGSEESAMEKAAKIMING